MGVPKYFRWLSERYPKINQPISCPPSASTQAQYFGNGDVAEGVSTSASTSTSTTGSNNKPVVMPEFDRLYLDMNGILHCCSHNNATEHMAKPSESGESQSQKEHANTNTNTNTNETDSALDAAGAEPAVAVAAVPAGGGITEEEVFRNVCYYLDRLVADIVQPTELVYMAIDGVAPRAKLNQQRSRRYRSGSEQELEATFYGAQQAQNIFDQQDQDGITHMDQDDPDQEQDQENPFANGNGNDSYGGYGGYGHDYTTPAPTKDTIGSTKTTKTAEGATGVGVGTLDSIQEVEPGRFTGKFEAGGTTKSPLAAAATATPVVGEQQQQEDDGMFHSNSITPGTPFFERCTAHITHFIQWKLTHDPKWKHLTIILSGPNVPGEGEHKIMDFLRREKASPKYRPNLRHCLFGQDADLIMLGLATHEPHFCLLREEVVFDQARKNANFNAHRDLASQDDKNNSENKMVLEASLNSYMHNSRFELLHMSILRDYLAYEFETNDVVPTSDFELESTIDDFVFLTFFVGNDFLPHMPALDIGDHAFDLLFVTYKGNRYKWLKKNYAQQELSPSSSKRQPQLADHPYLTHAGSIVSGKRLESFLQDLGHYENPYYERKHKQSADSNERIRRADAKAGRESLVPSQESLDMKEELDRIQYRAMLDRMEAPTTMDAGIGKDPSMTNAANIGFSPVVSSRLLPLVEKQNANDSTTTTTSTANGSIKRNAFQPTDPGEALDAGFFSRMSNLLKNSLAPPSTSSSSSPSSGPNQNNKYTASALTEDYTTDPELDNQILTDIKGRYYYDKFGFTPFDAEKHQALRKAYVEGLAWNLKYYYEGCASWEWYYPYHYGPMLSDIVNIDEILSEISFEKKVGKPLDPFQQLMGCMPPSSANLLPKPYRWLLQDPKSPLADFYPETFTVDMNGKRWPWEAVVLLPFIDSKRLIDAVEKHVTPNMLTEEESKRNERGEIVVLTHDEATSKRIPMLSEGHAFGSIEDCKARIDVIGKTQWDHDKSIPAVLRPEMHPDAIIPHPGFPSLREAPVRGLLRRKIGVNVFGTNSRYKTAVLEMDSEMPAFPPASVLGPKFIGTTLYFQYPFLREGFVTAVSDEHGTYRGNDPPKHWNKSEALIWKLRKDVVIDQYEMGEGTSGSGGCLIPDSNVTVCVRPLEGLETMQDGSRIKVYSKTEIEVPLFAALWSPTRPDPRYASIPARLEKDPFHFNAEAKFVGLKKRNTNFKSSKASGKRSTGKRSNSRASLLPPSGSGASNRGSGLTILPSSETMGNGVPLLKSTGGQRSISGSSILRNGHHTGKKSFSSVAIPKVHSIRATPATRAVGNTRVRLLTTAFAAAAFLSSGASFQSSAVPLPSVSSNTINNVSKNTAFLWNVRGGDAQQDGKDYLSDVTPPPLEFLHGTTTISFTFQGGIITAVDSRASMGNFVGSKTTQKVLPISRSILGTMAGGAADCSFWIRKLRSEAKLHELTNEGRGISVARASRLLSNALYENRGLDLSVGTMIMGYDDNGGHLYYVDNTGVRIPGDMFAVGSGSTFALGILDTERKFDMTEEEAITLGIKAIRHATFRDAFSGGFIACYLITKDGWRKIFSEDLALSTERMMQK